MPKMNVRASAYQVPRGKAEIARAAKWQKTAKLTTKKNLESKTPKPEEKGPEASGGQDPKKTPEAKVPKG
jgi:hypothetical protein